MVATIETSRNNVRRIGNKDIRERVHILEENEKVKKRYQKAFEAYTTLASGFRCVLQSCL